MNPKYFMKSVTVTFIFLMTVNQIFSQGALKTTALNVFKNGTYYVEKEGNVLLKQGKAKLEIPPAPLLSTFWLTTTRDIAISKMVFMADTLKSTRSARTFPDLLKANKGKRVKLGYKTDEKTYTEVAGTLLDFFPNGIAKIRTPEGRTLYMPTSDLRQLVFDDNPLETATVDSIAYLGNMEINKNIPSIPLKMVYMQAGIQWIPSYNIKVLNDNELQLEMRALVENFAEVVEDADLTLTVGDPQFRYGRATEPFAAYGLSSLYGTYPASGLNTYAFKNTLQAPAMAMDAGESARAPDYQDYQVYQTEGQKTGDLYMYRVGKVSIPKNSKASFQVFSQKVPYRDVYTVGIGDVVAYGSNAYINNNPDQRFDVYHSLKLTNTLKNPFTTAPVFVLDQNLEPLAQDEIKYTPAEGTVSVQLSKATDIIVRNTEEELSRADRAKTIDKYTYNRITIRGTVRVENLQDKSVVLSLDKSVNAQILTASDNGKVIKPGKYSGLNPFTKVTWEVTLGPNEKKEVTYEYEVFVLSR